MYYMSNINDVIKCAKKANQIVIWGQNNIGKGLSHKLESLGIRNIVFCDNDKKKQGKIYEGKRILSFEQVCIEFKKPLFIIAVQKYYEDIKTQILKTGNYEQELIVHYKEWVSQEIYMSENKKVLITGAAMQNSGAQAMTFITVSEIKKRFPNHDVVLWTFGNEYDSNYSKMKFKFTILPNPSQEQRQALINKSEQELNEDEQLFLITRLLQNVDIMIDISGYVMGSNWAENIWKSWMLQAGIAVKYDIKYYILPQSFGPMEFKHNDLEFIKEYTEKYLSKAECIYARELSGYKIWKEEYGLDNVILSKDLVLMNKGYDLHDIYFDIPPIGEWDISNSVAIIPHGGMNSFEKKETILDFYSECIHCCMSLGKNVYLIAHAEMDLEICRELSALTTAEILNVKKFECFQFEKCIENFDFMIGSRYHSLVHALKKSVPSISFGWSEKYDKLMDGFEMREFSYSLYNYKKEEWKTHLAKSIETLDKNRDIYAKKIRERLLELQQCNIYDVIH